MYDDDGGAPFERCANTKDGIAVWMSRAGSNAKEVLAEATFAKTPARAFWRAVCDVERYQEFVPFVKRSFVCKDARSSAGGGSVGVQRGEGAGGGTEGLRDQDRFDTPGADGSMTCAWHVPDDGVGPAALSGHVRLLKNSGGWELREANGGGGVAVRYRVLTDPARRCRVSGGPREPELGTGRHARAFNARATSGVYEREGRARRRRRDPIRFRGSR